MKFLVTGATGFIGHHVVPLLQQEHAQVAILTRDVSHVKLSSSENVRVIEGSLEFLDKCKTEIMEFQPDVCLHLAWEGLPDYSFRTSKKNLDQSIALIDFLFDETACQKIVVSGSCFEYGNTLGKLSETTADANLSAFAWAKNSLKNYLALRASEKKRSWLWMRVFYVFGPGQRSTSLIPSLVLAARQGLPCPIRNPKNANDFIYIDDAASALVAACKQQAESGVYNLGSGTLLKVSAIWELVQKQVATGAASSQADATSSEDAVGSYADILKIHAKFNWSPKWTVQKGIHQFVDSLLKQEASS